MMDNEDFERKMAFIVNQQAKFAVDIALLHEEQAKTSENISRTEAAMTAATNRMTAAENRLTEAEDLVTRLSRVTHEGFKQQGEKINTLIDAHIRHEKAFAERQKRIDERFDALTASQDRTEELLQKFLLGLTNRRNGK